ncbi:MAG: ATP-binding protein [Nitrososphaerota archaeon]|jgi:DNA helicase HerA-like ATPase|nr:ATP-binding protein [Nitrososphaerota archaeon]
MSPDDPNFDERMARRVRLRTAGSEKLLLVRGEARHTAFRFTDSLLLRHVLILGATGSGKTNHAFSAVQQAVADRPKSCLIVDVKSEYRKLDGMVREPVRPIAVGDEPRVSFNPLIPPASVEPDLWDRAFIDVFTRAYGLSEPSRRILLDCLWSLRQESRGSPTLRELESEVGRFKAGSSKEQNSQRSLESRLHIINMGPVGRSLNSEQALDFASMEDRVTVYEVGQIDSLRDQRFLAEVVLAQLWQYDKARALRDDGDGEKLRRLIVVEEAHRYLSEERPPQQRGERTLLELAIAEARRYGWGFIIVDQMPTLLSRYVWDNCGTVIAHRLTNLQSYEAVKNALGGDPLPGENDANGDPLALRLPEDLALFRRYVERGARQAGTGFAYVEKMKQVSDGEQHRS